MKTKALSSFFVLFAIAAGIVAMTPGAFADHSEVTIEPVAGSGVPGCEDTPEGCYSPSTATVDVGGKVIFSNTDNVAHTFSSGVATDADSVYAVFDSGLSLKGTSYEWSPTEAGDVPYFCLVHPWMIGMVIVQEVDEKHGNGDDDDGEMMMMPKGDASVTGMLSEGTMVSIWASTPTANEMMEISIVFDNAEHVNYDIMVTQNGEEVLYDKDAHRHDGMGVHMTKAVSSSDPVDITVTFQGYGVEGPKTGPVGEEVVYTNVVPEFGTIAMMILAVAIISIVAITTKSRVIPRF